MGVNPERFSFKTVLVIVLLGTFFSIACKKTKSVDTVESDSKLRSLYFMWDYETGYREGLKVAASFPSDVELHAWFILIMAKNKREKEAEDAAEKLLKKNRQNYWAWFALAGILNSLGEREEDALEASKKALSLAPEHPDIIWMRAQTLMIHDKREEAVEFVDNYSDRIQNPAELLATKGNSLYRLSNRGGDQEKFEKALEVWSEARRIDPSNLSAYFLPGYYLDGVRRFEDAYPLLKEAVRLSPGAASVHQALWRVIQGSNQKSAEEKQNEIKADIESFLEKMGEYPRSIYVASNMYGQINLKEKQKELEEKILNDFPKSQSTESILVFRYHDFFTKHGKEGFKDPEKEHQYRQMLWNFIQRPTHKSEKLIGSAYLNLFNSFKDDSSVSADELLEVVRGMVKYENFNPHIVYAQGAIALAERQSFFREARKIARAGIDAGRKRIDSQRGFYKTEADYQEGMNWMLELMYDALGWVFFKEGQLKNAEKELIYAYDLNPKHMDNLYHLGQLYEAQGNLEKAETYYVKGITIQTIGENLCLEALQNTFIKLKGGLEGFEQYLDGIKDRDRIGRKKEILASRISDLQLAPPFVLKTLDDKTLLSLENLKGKVVVINFWGIWCYWCVQEMPDVQKLYEKYRDVPDVVILTINNDPNPDDVPIWMKKMKYDFTVLLDDGYVASKANVSSFPTTWFIDKNGQIAFQKIAWSEKLFEEFSWRIEALRK